MSVMLRKTEDKIKNHKQLPKSSMIVQYMHRNEMGGKTKGEAKGNGARMRLVREMTRPSTDCTTTCMVVRARVRASACKCEDRGAQEQDGGKPNR